MRVKPGVVLPKNAAMCLIILAVDRVYKDLGYEAVITSGTEGVHGKNSFHYQDAALDFRTNFLDGEQKEWVTREIKKQLGDNFDVVLESDHLHIEHDPKVK